MPNRGSWKLFALGAFAVGSAGCSDPATASGPGTPGASGTATTTTGGATSATAGGAGPGVGGSTTGVTGGATSAAGGTPGTAGTPTTPAGGAASGVGGSAPVAGTAPAAGGTTAATGGAGGTVASAGAAPVAKDCATKTVVTTPAIVDFEAYDGIVTAEQFSFWFGSATAGTGTNAGFYAYSDEQETNPATMLIGGGFSSNFAMSMTVTQAKMWGGTLAIWMNPKCIDARMFTGVTFAIRGTTPLGTATVSIDMEQTSTPTADNPAGGGTCDAAAGTCKAPSVEGVAVTPDWTQITLPWSMFAGGLSGGVAVTPNGDNITSITFSGGITWMADPAFVDDPAIDTDMPEYLPVPGDINIQVDSLAFAP